MNPEKNLADLRKEWRGCMKCPLAALRESPDSPIVFHLGATPADYLFVYDAPEAEDADAGTPLQGRYGSILDDLIVKAEFPAGKVAFAPLVGCYPYSVLPATEDQKEQIRDRDPTTEEVEACAPRLSSIIYNVDPLLIFAVGDVSWKTLVRPKNRGGATTLGAAAGELYETFVEGKLRKVRYAVMPLLPPKQIVANPSAAGHGPIATTLEALMRAKKYVTMLRKDEIR